MIPLIGMMNPEPFGGSVMAGGGLFDETRSGKPAGNTCDDGRSAEHPAHWMNPVRSDCSYGRAEYYSHPEAGYTIPYPGFQKFSNDNGTIW